MKFSKYYFSAGNPKTINSSKSLEWKNQKFFSMDNNFNDGDRFPHPRTSVIVRKSPEEALNVQSRSHQWSSNPYYAQGTMPQQGPQGSMLAPPVANFPSNRFPPAFQRACKSVFCLARKWVHGWSLGDGCIRTDSTKMKLFVVVQTKFLNVKSII